MYCIETAMLYLYWLRSGRLTSLRCSGAEGTRGRLPTLLRPGMRGRGVRASYSSPSSSPPPTGGGQTRRTGAGRGRDLANCGLHLKAFFKYFWRLECVGHSFAYVCRPICIFERTQKAAVRAGALPT
jgi:hypothetical protein